MVRKTTFSLHETTVESYIIFRPILFLEAVASLGLVVTLSQSVSQSGSQGVRF